MKGDGSITMKTERSYSRSLWVASVLTAALAGATTLARAQEHTEREQRAHEESAEHGAAPATHGQLPHWTYYGETGPAKWGSLHPSFSACAAGTSQTPIDLKKISPDFVSSLSFDYKDSELRVINNGHTIQANFDLGSVITLDNKRYMLAQVHFHTPSEHTVSGKPYDLEAHLVHINLERELAVVGVFMKRGEPHRGLEKLWRDMPTQAGQSKVSAAERINGAEFLPERRDYHRYQGSLTTPPCSEGVNWVVMAEPVQLSEPQWERFVSVIGKNARPPQPLQGRTVAAGAAR